MTILNEIQTVLKNDTNQSEYIFMYNHDDENVGIIGNTTNNTTTIMLLGFLLTLSDEQLAEVIYHIIHEKPELINSVIEHINND